MLALRCVFACGTAVKRLFLPERALHQRYLMALLQAPALRFVLLHAFVPIGAFVLVLAFLALQNLGFEPFARQLKAVEERVRVFYFNQLFLEL